MVSGRDPIMVFWTPPIPQHFKLNTDGSLNHVTKNASVGCLIRDSNGECIKGFLVNIGRTSSFMAELCGLRDGLKVCRDLNIQHIAIEMDAASIVNMLQEENQPEEALSTLMIDCYVILKQFSSYTIRHVFREANQITELGHNVARELTILQANFSLFYRVFGSPVLCFLSPSAEKSEFVSVHRQSTSFLSPRLFLIATNCVSPLPLSFIHQRWKIWRKSLWFDITTHINRDFVDVDAIILFSLMLDDKTGLHLPPKDKYCNRRMPSNKLFNPSQLNLHLLLSPNQLKPRFMAIVMEELDKPCLDLFEGLLQHGRLTVAQMIDRARSSQNQAEGNDAVADGIRESFSKLLNLRFVERCPAPEPVVPIEAPFPFVKRGSKSAKLQKIETETFEQRLLKEAAPL